MEIHSKILKTQNIDGFNYRNAKLILHDQMYSEQYKNKRIIINWKISVNFTYMVKWIMSLVIN